MANFTIQGCVERFLSNLSDSHPKNTYLTYRNGLNAFLISLKDHNLDPQTAAPADLPEDAIAWLASDLRHTAATTERLYLTAAVRFYEYLVLENLSSINLIRIRLLIRNRARRPGARLPQYPHENINILLDYAINLANHQPDDTQDILRNLRDKAFILTLADTGLRVHEACNLRRGDVDWNEGHAVVIGKGDRQAVIRFSKRSLQYLRDYLAARSHLDGNSGKPLASLPLFARHDKGAGKKVKSMTPTTGRNILAQRVQEALGLEAAGTITPHSLRHYFVTTVLRGSGNLKLAQELARHQNIAVTQRYAHLSDDELDQGYYEIFDRE
jgi:site-specific recombinase XerD